MSMCRGLPIYALSMISILLSLEVMSQGCVVIWADYFFLKVPSTIINILGVLFLDSPSLESSLRLSCKVADWSGRPYFDGLCVNCLDNIQVQNRGHSNHLDLQPIALPDHTPCTTMLEWLDFGVLCRLTHCLGNMFSLDKVWNSWTMPSATVLTGILPISWPPFLE